MVLFSHKRGAVPCCAEPKLCCAVPCLSYAVLCCAVLCCAVLCCAVLCRAVPCRAVPCLSCAKRAMHAGVDIQAVIHDMPTFVSSFDYSLASQAFLQRPAAAGRMAHLDTLSVHHTAEALQIHGTSLLNEAQQAVSELVNGHLQQLCEVLRQQEVIAVLEAARAAIRATAEAEGQGPAALRMNEGAQSSQEAASIRQDEDTGAHRTGQEQKFNSLDGSDGRASWLQHLTGAQLVEHAEMVQAGLQQQQLAGSHHSCLQHIEGLVTGASVRSHKGCVLQCSPVASCPVSPDVQWFRLLCCL